MGERFWDFINGVFARPSVAFFTLGFFLAWFILSITTKVDPGGTLGNYLQTFVQSILCFAAVSLSAKAAASSSAAHGHAQETHRLARGHAKSIEDLHGRVDRALGKVKP